MTLGFAITLLSICILSFGQKDLMNFGAIPMEDFAMTSYAKDLQTEYLPLKELHIQIVEKPEEQIVLKKK